MKAVIFGSVIFGVIILAGFWELRREWRQAGEKLGAFIHAERPAEDCGDALDDALTTGVITPDKLEALIWATREDTPLSMAWCNPGDVDRIDELVHVWARQQEGR